MRLSRSLLRQRVNTQAALRFECEGLTSFSGLELVRVFFVGLDLPRRLRDALNRHLPGSDYPAANLVLLLLALIITGGRRLSHVRSLAHDPIVARFCGLARLPTDRRHRWNRPSTPALPDLATRCTCAARDMASAIKPASAMAILGTLTDQQTADGRRPTAFEAARFCNYRVAAT